MAVVGVQEQILRDSRGPVFPDPTLTGSPCMLNVYPVRPPIRVGLVGTGFIGRGLLDALRNRSDMVVQRVLTRRPPEHFSNFPEQDVLTASLAELVDESDVIVECSGDVAHATRVVTEAFKADRPVVTMNSEFHVTVGSWFVDKGLLTEAAGDQPGTLAELHEQAVDMGFRPVVYGNLKRFHDPAPSEESMQYWAARQGISVDQVTAFTNGTKLQIEQALVANSLGATVAVPGMLGLQESDVERGGQELAEVARDNSSPIADYLISPGLPGGVFIVAQHDECQRERLRYLKLGDGPFYLLQRNYHLCHLEIPGTIKRVMCGGGVLLNNSQTPTVTVTAVASARMPQGAVIRRGIGSRDIRGVANKIEDCDGLVPIGLLDGARVRRALVPGDSISEDDVSLAETQAHQIWKNQTQPGREMSASDQVNETRSRAA